MTYSSFLLLFLCLLPAMTLADGQPPTPSVEDNIRALDTDRDGQVSVSEIRAYLETKYGKGYERALLHDMETKANTSCGTPFSRSFY